MSSVEPSAGLLESRLGRAAIAAAVCIALGGLAVHSIKLNVVVKPNGNLTRGDGTMLGALRGHGQIRLVTFWIGLAARDAAGGPVRAIVGPQDLSDLAIVPGSEGTVGPYSGYYLQQMSGWGLKVEEYELRLSAEEESRLRSGRKVVEYPSGVVGVVGDGSDDEVVLVTDEPRGINYVVPRSVLEEVRR